MANVSDFAGLTAGDIIGNVIIREYNAAAIATAIDQAKMKALEEIGLKAEGYAKAACPVDTGRLRNSITHQLHGDYVAVGTNVEYAPYIEFGHHDVAARPYLKPAASDHGDEYRDILKKCMGD